MISFRSKEHVCIVHFPGSVFLLARIDHIVILYRVDLRPNRIFQRELERETLRRAIKENIDLLLQLPMREVTELQDLQYAESAVRGMCSFMLCS